MAIAGTTERLFPDAGAQAAGLADAVAADLTEALGETGAVALVVTGGSTPGPAYDRLSQKALPWARVRVTLSDERWVPPADAESNERLVRERLLTGPAAAAGFTPLKTSDPTPAAALPAVERAVAALPRPFAAVVLGMGEDGHVASLFPGDASPEALDAEAAALVASARSPAGVARLSLTLRALVDARRIYLLVRGEKKRAVLRDAAAGRSPHLPIAALFRQAHRPVEVFWSP